MVAFNEALAEAVVRSRSFGRFGAPWEFNLRDLLRWCQLAEAAVAAEAGEGTRARALPAAAAAVAPALYLHRLRSEVDRAAAARLFALHFPDAPPAHPRPAPALRLGDGWVAIGCALLPRGDAAPPAAARRLQLLRGQLRAAEAAACALARGWMVQLVGPAACGKTSLARALAALAGATLVEVRRPPPPRTPAGR